MAQTLTSGLTANMQTYYDKRFLSLAKVELKHAQFADKRAIPANSGVIVNWTRYTQPAAATSALTEGTNPTAAAAVSSTVTATVAQYGYVQQHSDLVSLTNIDPSLEKRTDVLAAQAGETIDTITRNAMFTDATVLLPAGRAAITNILVTDVLTAPIIRRAVRNLKTNKAHTLSKGAFGGIISEFAAMDLASDTTWATAHTYPGGADNKNMYDSYIGRFCGVDFVETNNGKTEASTVTVYSNFIFGDEAYAVADIEGSGSPKMIVKTPGPNDTSNALNMYSTVGWKALFAAKVLNPNWIINAKTGATA